MPLTGVPITTVRDWGIEKVEVVARAVPGRELDLAYIGDLFTPIAANSIVASPDANRQGRKITHEESILRRINRDMER